MTESRQQAVPSWVPLFLGALRSGKGAREACRLAGVCSSTPYHRRDNDPTFRAEWDAIEVADGRRAKKKPPAKRGKTKHERFLVELAETSNVAAACAVAGLSTSQVYRLRRTDPEFARRWYAALAEGYDNLEMELLGRLRAGDAGEAGASGKGKFDTAAALRCLAAHREAVTREKGRRTLADEVATIESINAKIDRLRLNQQESDKAIAAARKAVRARQSSSSEAVGQTNLKESGDGEA